MLAAIKTGAGFVAPPFERERPDGDDVALAHAGSREELVDPELLQAMHDFGECLIVGEVTEANGTLRRAPGDAPAVSTRAFDGDLFGNGTVHHDLVLER